MPSAATTPPPKADEDINLGSSRSFFPDSTTEGSNLLTSTIRRGRKRIGFMASRLVNSSFTPPAMKS